MNKFKLDINSLERLPPRPPLPRSKNLSRASNISRASSKGSAGERKPLQSRSAGGSPRNSRLPNIRDFRLRINSLECLPQQPPLPRGHSRNSSRNGSVTLSRSGFQVVSSCPTMESLPFSSTETIRTGCSEKSRCRALRQAELDIEIQKMESARYSADVETDAGLDGDSDSCYSTESDGDFDISRSSTFSDECPLGESPLSACRPSLQEGSPAVQEESRCCDQAPSPCDKPVLSTHLLQNHPALGLAEGCCHLSCKERPSWTKMNCVGDKDAVGTSADSHNLASGFVLSDTGTSISSSSPRRSFSSFWHFLRKAPTDIASPCNRVASLSRLSRLFQKGREKARSKTVGIACTSNGD